MVCPGVSNIGACIGMAWRAFESTHCGFHRELLPVSLGWGLRQCPLAGGAEALAWAPYLGNRSSSQEFLSPAARHCHFREVHKRLEPGLSSYKDQPWFCGEAQESVIFKTWSTSSKAHARMQASDLGLCGCPASGGGGIDINWRSSLELLKNWAWVWVPGNRLFFFRF